jgi:hypothetical protein
MLRIFRRIADYNNPVQATNFDAVTIDVDQITVPALYSDRRPPPSDYLSKLNNAANSGGYLLTHVLLATIWLQYNHYEPPIPNDYKRSLYLATAGQIGDDSVVTDLEIEAAALLYMAGQGTLVDDAFVQHAIAAQNFDGVGRVQAMYQLVQTGTLQFRTHALTACRISSRLVPANARTCSRLLWRLFESTDCVLYCSLAFCSSQRKEENCAI